MGTGTGARAWPLGYLGPRGMCHWPAPTLTQIFSTPTCLGPISENGTWVVQPRTCLVWEDSLEGWHVDAQEVIQQVDEVLGRQNRPLTGPPVRALRPQVAHPSSCLTLWDPPPTTSLKPAGFSGLKGPGVTKELEENECPSLVHWTSLMTNGKWSPPVSPLQTPDTQNEDRCGRFPPSSESGGWL